MTGEINSSILKQAISTANKKKEKKAAEAHDEQKSIEIAREGTGDNVQSSTAVGSTQQTSTDVNQEAERVEKTIERPGQKIVAEANEEETKKAEEESKKQLEELEENILSNWGDVGGKE